MTAADIRNVLVRSLTGLDRRDDLDLGPLANDLHRAADWHRITPAVYLYLRDLTRSPDVIGPLERGYQRQMARHLQTVADLKITADALDAADIGWVVIKGPALSARWPRPDMREYHDLDLLVDRRRFSDALVTLHASGAELVDRNQPMILKQLRAELTLRLRHGTKLDLHWDPVNDAALRRDFSFPTDRMLQHRASMPIGAVSVPVLEPVDALLHVGYHTTLSGAHRLLWLMDMIVLGSEVVDWTSVSRRAGAYGVELPLALALDRAARVFGTSAARHHSKRFRGWRLASRAVDAIRPVPQIPGAGGSSRVLYQNVRQTSWRSVRPTISDAVRRKAAVGSPLWQNPLHQDIPDPAAWRRYLSLVQGQEKP